MDLTRRKNDRRGPVGILLVTPQLLYHASPFGPRGIHWKWRYHLSTNDSERSLAGKFHVQQTASFDSKVAIKRISIPLALHFFASLASLSNYRDNYKNLVKERCQSDLYGFNHVENI